MRVKEVFDCEDPSEKTRAVRSVFTGLIERTIKYFKKKPLELTRGPLSYSDVKNKLAVLREVLNCSYHTSLRSVCLEEVINVCA